MVYTFQEISSKGQGIQFPQFVPFWFLKTRHGGWNSDIGNIDCLQTAGGGAGVHLWTHFSQLFKSFCVTIIMPAKSNPLMAFSCPHSILLLINDVSIMSKVKRRFRRGGRIEVRLIHGSLS